MVSEADVGRDTFQKPKKIKLQLQELSNHNKEIKEFNESSKDKTDKKHSLNTSGQDCAVLEAITQYSWPPVFDGLTGFFLLKIKAAKLYIIM